MALDELGRGTATTDGVAIAAAVLDHLATEVGCRGLFATHYHRLSDTHAADPAVSVKHMGCAVQPKTVRDAARVHVCATSGICGKNTICSAQDGVPHVTFLYTLTDGACPKSYGTNVARLAGLPAELVMRASALSNTLEANGDSQKAARLVDSVGQVLGAPDDDAAKQARLVALQHEC